MIARRTGTALRRARALIFVAVAGCSGLGDDAGGGWEPFESTEGGFGMTVPETPTHRTTADGKEHRFDAELRGGRVVLRVAYERGYDTSIPIPRRFAEIAKLPDVRGAVAPTPISLGAHAGMEATYEMASDGTNFVVRHRIYHVGRTSYQVMAVAPKGTRADAEIERFLGSFRLL